MSDSQLASVVIPCLDEAEHIGALLEGVLRQRHRPLEVIVVDGGSRDGTRNVVLNLHAKAREAGVELRLLREEGAVRSPGNARNVGIEGARGRWIVLLDGDFFMVDDGFVGDVVAALGSRRSVSARVRHAQDTPVERHLALHAPIVAAVGYRREVFDHVRFDPTLGYGEDEHLWKRASIDIHDACDAWVGRHEPHTWGEAYRQMRWYGRTLPTFLRAMKRVPQVTWRRVLQRHVVARVPRAAFHTIMPFMTLVLLIAWPLVGIAALALHALLLVRSYLSSALPRPPHGFGMFVAHTFVQSAGLVVGLVQGLVPQPPGRG